MWFIFIYHLPNVATPSFEYTLTVLNFKNTNIVLSLGKKLVGIVFNIISKFLDYLESMPAIYYFEWPKG